MTPPDAPAVPVDGSSRPRLRRAAPWLAVATAVLLLAGATWWLHWSEPVVAEGGYGVTIPDTQPQQPYTFAVEALCLDGAETATVEDVTVDRTGLTVTGFAVGPRPEPPALGTGSGEGSLTERGLGEARSFSGQCDDGAYTELALEVSRNANGPAHTETVDLHWRAGLRSGVLTLPLSITLCPTGDETELCTDGS